MRINRSFRRPSRQLVETYRGVAPAFLGHKHNIRVMDTGIRPLIENVVLVGPALTVRAGGMDAGALAEVDAIAEPGDVVVVDRGGDTEFACIGEFRALKQIRLGVAGWIVDGAATDLLEIRKMRFPLYARSVSALVGKMLDVEGDVGCPIQCGGVVVNPGDLVVGDDNGVVVLSEVEAQDYLEEGLAAAERERNMRVEYEAEYSKLLTGE